MNWVIFSFEVLHDANIQELSMAEQNYDNSTQYDIQNTFFSHLQLLILFIYKSKTKMQNSSQVNLYEAVQLSPVIQNKYGLIVVGRMGHGKSSFCKMFLEGKQRQKVKASTSLESVTTECNIYRSSCFKDIFGEDIYLVDTPGLDSKASVSLIVEEIDELVQEHKANIVGIAYVLDINQREQSQQKKNYIFTFLELLSIKYCYKVNLSFCILSKFDKYYDQDQANELLFREFKEIFEKHSYGKMWESRIQWMSEPALDIVKWNEKITKYHDKEYQRQIEKVKQFLKEREVEKKALKDNALRDNAQERSYLSYKIYERDRLQFEQVLKNRLIDQYSSFSFKKQTSSFDIELNVSPLKTSLASVGIKSGAIGAVSGGIMILRACVVGVIGVASIATLPIVAASSIATIGLGLYSLLKRSKLPQEQVSAAVMARQKVVSKKLEDKLKVYLITATLKKAEWSSRYITVKGLPYITSIERLREQQDNVQAKKIQIDDEWGWQLSLCTGKNKIRFTFMLPANESYQPFLRQVSKNFFNEKQ